jgi:hypothetical protein
MSASAASPFDSLLAQSKDLVGDRVSEALAAMLDKADETLSTMMGETQSTETQELYRKTRDAALANRNEFEKVFRTRFGKDFDSRASKVRKVTQSLSDIDLSDMELELVGEDDLTETLKFNEMATKARRICDEEMAALDQRMGVLLGDADLQSEDNPVSPNVICDAYKHACKKIDGETPAVRLVMLKLFDDHLLDGLRAIYKDVNTLLVKNQILPKIRYGVSKKDGGKAPSVQEPAAGAEKAAAPTEQDFFAMMQNFMKASGSLPGIAPGVGGAGGQVVVLQGAELLSSLSRLQAGGGGGGGGAEGGGDLPVLNLGETGTNNVLRELKGTSVGASMGQMDAMTLDIVSMIFDQLFDEPKVPVAVKGLLGRMQIPMLKVAIADKAFFSDKTHPARKMLDTIGEISVRLPADFSASNPLFQEMEKLINEVIDGFKDNVEIFDTVREKFHGLMIVEDQRLTKETEAQAKRMKEAEDLALAKTVSQNEIKQRLKGKVSSGRVPRFVVDFLIRHWVKFLLLVHAKRGKDSDAWKSSLGIMDELIWSVEPKDTLEERRKLATVTRFMEDLMKRHTEIVSNEETLAPAAVPAGTAAAAVDPNPSNPGGPSSRPVTDPNRTLPGKPSSKPAADSNRTMPGGPSSRQPAKPAAKAPAKVEEADLDFTDDLTVKNPFGGGEVQVKQLDFTDLAATPAKARAVQKDADMTEHLVEGSWVEVKDKDTDDKITVRPARLSFVSPMRTSYLFVDRNGKTVLECSRAELARRYRLKEVVDMDEAPLFDRIMTGLVGKMKTGAQPAGKAPG